MTILLVVLAISFLLKLAIGFHLRHSFLSRGNNHTPYNALAFNLAFRGQFALVPGIPSIDYEPLYLLLMAASYKMFGVNWFGITLVQSILHALSSLLVFKVGGLIGGERGALMAAIYHAFYPYLFMQAVSINEVTLFSFLLLLIVFLVIRKKNHGPKCIFIGLALGLALLTRGSIIALLPPLAWFLVRDWRRSLSPAAIVRSSLILGSALFIVLLPWLLRNHGLTKQVLISAHGSYGFWQGNNLHSRYLLENDISLDEIYRLKPLPDVYRKHSSIAGSPREAIAIAAEFRSAAFDFIRNRPGEFLRLAALKFVKLWTWVRNPRSSNLDESGNRSRQVVYLLSYLPLLMALPFGMGILFRKNRTAFYLLLGILGCYTLAHMVIMGYTRLRLPLDPFLIILAGIAISSLWEMHLCFGPNKA